MSDATKSERERKAAPMYYLTADVKAAAQGRWRDILGRFGVRAELLTGRHGPCPGCGGRDRFRFDDIGGHGTFLCSQGTGDMLVGDGLKLLGHVKGWDWKRCLQEVGDELNVELRTGTPSKRDEGVAVEPRSNPKARPEVDDYALWEATRGLPAIDESWLARRSPLDVAGVTPGAFLDAIFQTGDRILVFTSQMTQGDFLWWAGKGGYRLSQERGVKAIPSNLPAGGRDGVWYLVQPVSGLWEVNETLKLQEGQAPQKSGRWTRRSQINVTAWRNFVLESDTLEAAIWLKVLAGLRLPIVAIYTSGGRSVHALVRMEVPSKSVWDATRDYLRQIVCPLGADPGALSAVRLSRLPGCLRGQKAQRLLFLNPKADGTAIQLLPEVRK
jgi:hypothetical protein